MTPVWQVKPHSEATERESPGMFREHDIRLFDGGMTPPTWPLIPARLRDWLDRVEALGPRLTTSARDSALLPELLAELHSGFEQVHPFIDGNGRTGRLVLNLILVRLGLPPVVILMTRRPAYLAALQKNDVGDHGPLGEIIARAMYGNLNRFIVPNVAGPARLVPRISLADKNSSIAALRQAASRGRLDAIQSADGTWQSSREPVSEYARTKGRRADRT